MKQKDISQMESVGIASWLDEKKRARNKASLYWEGCGISTAIKERDMLNNRF